MGRAREVDSILDRVEDSGRKCRNDVRLTAKDRYAGFTRICFGSVDESDGPPESMRRPWDFSH